MNTSYVKAFWVGLVAMVGLAVAAVGIFVVGNEQKLWDGRSTYEIRFARTDGLQESAPVTLHGVNVGTVKSMRFPTDPDTTYVEVTLSISDSVGPRIRKDTTGRLQTFGLLGNKYIELIGGSVGSPVLEPGGLLQSIDPVDYEVILSRSGDIVSNVIEVTALLKELLIAINTGDGLIGRLIKDAEFGKETLSRTHAAMVSIEQAAQSMSSASARLDSILTDVQEGHGALGVLLTDDQSMQQVLGSLRSASADAAELAAELREGEGLVKRLATDKAYAEELLDNLSRVSTNAAQISEQVRSGEGTVGKLVYDDKLYNDVEDFLGGSSAGFWKMLMHPLKFFWPFSSDDSEIDGADGPGTPEPPSAAPRDVLAPETSTRAETSPRQGAADGPATDPLAGGPASSEAVSRTAAGASGRDGAATVEQDATARAQAPGAGGSAAPPASGR